MNTLSPDQLAEALRAGAEGSLLEEAAITLIITHGSWLPRTDFVTAAVTISPASDDTAANREPYLAFIDWAAALAADLPASASKHQILALAAELAGTDSGLPLGHLMIGLDRANTARVVWAISSISPSGPLRAWHP